MQVIIDNQKIDYTFKRLCRSRTLRISIRRDGKVSVTAPFFVSSKQGEKFLIQNGNWVKEKLKQHKENSAKSIFPSGNKDFLINKSRALHLVRDKIAKLNAIYGFKYAKVSIKKMSTRWGSCSKQGNLNFNYKMIYLSDDLAEYIVAHELCHLSQMNHGRNFWKLVAHTISNWQILRRQLKNIN